VERRTLLAFFLIFLVLLLWNLYLWQQRPPTKGSKAPQEERKVIEKKEAPPKKGEEVLLKEEGLKQARSPISEEEVVVENPLYQVRFSSIGGTITSFKLKQYRDPNGNWVELIPPGKRALALSIEEDGKTLNFLELPFELNRDAKT